MVLIHYCTVSPTGSSKLAAIRFAAPIRVSFIRIFSAGTRPFAQCPDILANTEPTSFYLDVFFNAHAVSPNPKDKQRAPNALVPTTIAYTGGQMDFMVDLGTEYATRLMIVKGDFENLSLAVYGENLSEESATTAAHTSSSRLSLPPPSLSKALDPANSSDPTALACQLLSLVPDPPSLSLVVRLILSLKPQPDDWDLPEFPHLYAELEGDFDLLDLDSVVDKLARPVPESMMEEYFTRLAEAIVDLIGPKTEAQAVQFSQILELSASQAPSMTVILCRHIDWSTIFDENTITESALGHLMNATYNTDIAAYLNADQFLDILHEIQIRSDPMDSLGRSAERLASRIRAWNVFMHALEDDEGDFFESIRFIKETGLKERSLGIWLYTMIQQEACSSKLTQSTLEADIAVPRLLSSPTSVVARADFLSFVRGYLGAACVMAVLGWADSLGNESCRGRALAILHVWQNTPGYAEIVNHLFLLPQFTRRLEWIIPGHDQPSKSAALAERVILELVKAPQAVLNVDVSTAILSLHPPLAVIQEAERLALRKAAFVAEDGLAAAIEELAFDSDHPLSPRRVYTLRVSLAIVVKEFEGQDSHWDALKLAWEEHDVNLLARLVDILTGVSDDLDSHFVLNPSPELDGFIVEPLLQLSHELIQLIWVICPTTLFSSPTLKNLVHALVTVLICADTAPQLFPTSDQIRTISQSIHLSALDFLLAQCDPGVQVEPSTTGAQVILRALLEQATSYGTRDPVQHLSKTFSILEQLLPLPSESTVWVTLVLPSALPELLSFYQLLDADRRATLLRHLAQLDDGLIGIAEMFILEDLRSLSQLLTTPPHGLLQQQIEQYHIHQLLQTFSNLQQYATDSPPLLIQVITSTVDAAQYLRTSLLSLYHGCYVSRSLIVLSKVLASHFAEIEEEELRFAIILIHLYQIQHDLTFFTSAPLPTMLTSVRISSQEVDVLRDELGRVLAVLSSDDVTINADAAQSTVALLGWLVDHPEKKYTSLRHLSDVQLARLFTKVADSLPESDLPSFEAIRPQLSVDDVSMEDTDSTTPIVLREAMRLPIDVINDLLVPPAYRTPSTPRQSSGPDILGLMISPPTAVLRSPQAAATGLTKTYANNDFRQLRQVQAARQNTSRLPSMHVDEFEITSPTVLEPLSENFNPLQFQYNVDA